MIASAARFPASEFRGRLLVGDLGAGAYGFQEGTGGDFEPEAVGEWKMEALRVNADLAFILRFTGGLPYDIPSLDVTFASLGEKLRATGQLWDADSEEWSADVTQWDQDWYSATAPASLLTKLTAAVGTWIPVWLRGAP